MKGMFKQEVPEIYDEIIQIMAVARDQEVEQKLSFIQRRLTPLAPA